MIMMSMRKNRIWWTHTTRGSNSEILRYCSIYAESGEARRRRDRLWSQEGKDRSD
jgi:hypothetical protein